MQIEFWHNAWESEKTGWQQQRVNTRLQRFWPQMGVSEGQCVLVPLCGDSIDMLWLYEQGFEVVGAELSQKAIECFFETHNLSANVTDSGHHQLYSCPGLRLFCGDFFTLRPQQLGSLAAVYDRAATVAMPTDLRANYASQIKALTGPATPVLLISMAYDQGKMKGPPFSVPHDNIASLYADAFTIETLGSTSGPEILGNLAERGLDELEESVYKMVRRADN